MQKILTYISVLCLLPLSLEAACPKLAGEYWCLNNNSNGEQTLDLYVVEQSQDSENPNMTNFSTRYSSISGGGDYFSADEFGIQDDFGWIVKCTSNKVVSVRNDFAAISELYLDKSDKLVRTYNYNIVQSCSRKK